MHFHSHLYCWRSEAFDLSFGINFNEAIFGNSLGNCLNPPGFKIGVKCFLLLLYSSPIVEHNSNTFLAGEFIQFKSGMKIIFNVKICRIVSVSADEDPIADQSEVSIICVNQSELTWQVAAAIAPELWPG